MLILYFDYRRKSRAAIRSDMIPRKLHEDYRSAVQQLMELQERRMADQYKWISSAKQTMAQTEELFRRVEAEIPGDWEQLRNAQSTDLHTRIAALKAEIQEYESRLNSH